MTTKDAKEKKIIAARGAITAIEEHQQYLLKRHDKAKADEISASALAAGLQEKLVAAGKRREQAQAHLEWVKSMPVSD